MKDLNKFVFNRMLNLGGQIMKTIPAMISFAPKFEIRDFYQFTIARY